LTFLIFHFAQKVVGNLKRLSRILFTILRIAIAIALLVYLAVSGAISWSTLKGVVHAWPITLMALWVLLVATAAAAWRLCVLLKPHGFHLTVGSSLRLTLMGVFFNACLPGGTGGDVVKIYYAAEGNRGRRTEVATVLLLDRAVGMFAMLLWPLLAAPFFTGMIASSSLIQGLLWTAGAIWLVMLACMLGSLSSRVRRSRLMCWIFRTLPLGRYAEQVFDTVHFYRHNTGTLLASVGISLLVITINVGVMLLIAKAVVPTGFAWKMSLLLPLGLLANALPVTPGGLGVGEASLDKLFAVAGLAGGAEIMLAWRMLSMLTGIIGLVYYLQGRKYFGQESLSLPRVKEELSYQ
jgi:hypothetical protein